MCTAFIADGERDWKEWLRYHWECFGEWARPRLRRLMGAWLYNNLANILTWSRLPLSIVIVCLANINPALVIPIVWLGLSGYITDALDGAWARFTWTASNFGRWLDCTMDKPLELSLFSFLLRSGRMDGLFWVVLPSAVIEAISLVLRGTILWEGIKTTTTFFGKWKMRLLGVATSACLAKLIVEDYYPQVRWAPELHQFIFLVFATGFAFALWSLWQHFKEYRLHEAE